MPDKIDALTNVPPPALAVMTPSNNQNIFQPALYTRSNDRSTLHGGGKKGITGRHRIEMAFRSGLSSERRWAIAALLEESFKSTDLKDTQLKSLVESVLEEARVPPLEAFLKFDESVGEISEILLLLRNICIEQDNARVVSYLKNVKSLLDSSLQLPNLSETHEVRTYALEICESVCTHISPSNSKLFPGLASFLESDDRASLVSANRALSRLCVYDENNTIRSLELSKVHKLLRLVLLNDDELLASALDLLYQYTQRLATLSSLWGDNPRNEQWISQILSTHLVRLLTYKVHREEPDFVRLPRRTKRPTPAEPPKLDEAILQELLAISEPERSTNWIRASYEPDPDAEVTQISLWKAYEGQFESFVRAGRGRLPPAVDFIKNVANAFRNVAAMVVNLPNGERRFIIKGMRPRETPVSPAVYNKLHASSLPDAQRRVPLPLCSTAAMLLQNVARMPEGKQLLRHTVTDIIEAMTINTQITPHVDRLLTILSE